MSTTEDVNPLGVPAHRHTNANGDLGGWVADTATVPAHVYVGRFARVYGGTIEGGTIDGGTIEGGTIEGGTIWGGTIWGGTIEGGTIWGGTIWGGAIEGGTIWGGTIWGGTIRGGAHIVHTRHVLTLGPLGSEDQTLTLHRTETGHAVHVGCWTDGLIDQLASEVQERAPQFADEYAEAEAMCRRRIAEWDAEGYPAPSTGEAAGE